MCMTKVINNIRIMICFVMLVMLIVSCSNNPQVFTDATTIPKHKTPTIGYTSTYEAEQIPTSTVTPPTPIVTHSLTPRPASPTGTISPTPFSLPTIPTGQITFVIWGSLQESGVGVANSKVSNSIQLTDWCYFCYSASWSPDGHWIAFDASFELGDQIEIYLIKSDGSEMKRITYAPHNKTDVAWSPIGQNIAYIESDDICVVNVDGNEYEKLTYSPEIEMSPAWSPDGQQIAFLRFLKDKNVGEGRLTWALMVMDADGNNVRQVTDFLAGPSRLTWSPNGERIALTSSGSCGDIYTVKLDGSDISRLTNIIGGCASNPTWSPDGKFIAFNASNEVDGDIVSMGWKIYIMKSNGSNITPILSGQGWVPLRPDWAPVPALLIDGNYKISELGDKLNLREAPAVNGAIKLQLHEGDIVTVLEGPVDADDYFWWKLRTEDGIEGWAVEVAGWYQPLIEP